MDGYLLSYNPNDFFWVSVQDQFDFSQCGNILNTNAAPTPSVKTSIDASGNACYIPPTPTCAAYSNNTCPTLPSTNFENEWNEWISTQAPTTKPTFSADFLFNQKYNQPIFKDTSGNQIVDLNGAFATQLCENYVKGNTLLGIQNEVSTTQVLFSDIERNTNVQLKNIFNMTGGILGIIVIGIMLSRAN
jgi:hypothetical protein